jgi:hypothetical protein
MSYWAYVGLLGLPKFSVLALAFVDCRLDGSRAHECHLGESESCWSFWDA